MCFPSGSAIPGRECLWLLARGTGNHGQDGHGTLGQDGRATLQRVDEVQQALLIGRAEIDVAVPRCLSLASVHPDGLVYRIRAPVVHEERPEERSPQRRSTPLVTLRLTLADAIGKLRTHSMEEQVGIEGHGPVT